MKRTVYLLSVIFLLLSSCVKKNQKEFQLPEKPNFLIFFIDDLRPELGCYGQDHIYSPNIDQLASEGIRFDRAYCNVPVCGASRASLMTGARPAPNRFVTYYTRADEDLPERITLPEYFKILGYHTTSLGKVFHHGDDSPESWSEPAWHAEPARVNSWRDYITDEVVENFSREGHEEPSSEIAYNVPDSAYIDGRTANKAIKKLRQFSNDTTPFMLWVGFVKPHLPFNAPSKYWDLYNRDSIYPASNPEPPLNAPDISLHNSGELRGYTDIPPTGPVSDEKARELIHGYYACVSYTDALIGRVLEELERLELDENTVVVLFGDHGWNLGEHGLWCKHCNYHTSLHVPLIMRIPGSGKTKYLSEGASAAGLVEFIDLYPTFTEIAGFDIPDYLDGKSVLPVAREPGITWTDPVFPRYGKGNSIVTENLVYTEYQESLENDSIIARMLYDHRNDPAENVNVVSDDDFQNLVEELSIQLKEIQ